MHSTNKSCPRATTLNLDTEPQRKYPFKVQFCIYIKRLRLYFLPFQLQERLYSPIIAYKQHILGSVKYQVKWKEIHDTIFHHELGKLFEYQPHRSISVHITHAYVFGLHGKKDGSIWLTTQKMMPKI